MATNQLALYNIGLLAIGETRLNATTDETEARRELDEVWDRGLGARQYFLSQGLWNFAMRAVKLTSSSSVTPDFGFTDAFDIPSDFVRLDMISSDERFSYPLVHYEFEGDYIYSDVNIIYMRYVSNDASWGLDYDKWPVDFTLWAGTWLGVQVAPLLKSDIDMEVLRRELKRLKASARSKDMSQEPTRYEPTGNWTTSRHGGTSRRDRGKSSRLIG